MIILTVRTDKPEAEIGIYDGKHQIAYFSWTAHRQLAETLLIQITTLLQNNALSLPALQGIACYAGPGSFTGLRIGLTVANSLAYGLQIPVIAESGTSDVWQSHAIMKLQAGKTDTVAMPNYGADVMITQPKN